MAVSVLRELFRSHRPLFEERRGAASVGTSKLRSDSGINVLPCTNLYKIPTDQHNTGSSDG
jgi:hypothetical protein